MWWIKTNQILYPKKEKRKINQITHSTRIPFRLKHSTWNTLLAILTIWSIIFGWFIFVLFLVFSFHGLEIATCYLLVNKRAWKKKKNNYNKQINEKIFIFSNVEKKTLFILYFFRSFKSIFLKKYFFLNYPLFKNFKEVLIHFLINLPCFFIFPTEYNNYD